MNNKLLEGWRAVLNRFGLFTQQQYLEQVELKTEALQYCGYLERAIDGLSDPAKPIVVFGNGIMIRDVSLLRGQQIIVSPRAKYVQISNVLCLCKSEMP